MTATTRVTPPSAGTTARYELVLDPIACDGAGLCAELLPELIHLDRWGFPMLDGTAVAPHLEAHARAAVDRCPKLALTVRRLPR
jgi:ferredoxin